jgi:hypothetical protein
MVAILLILGLSNEPPQQTGCWVDIGTKSLYGTYLQSEDPTWHVSMRPDRHSLMLRDSKNEVVARIHVEGSTTSWEVWRGVDRSHILTDDPSREFDYAILRTGEGKAPLSSDARELIRQNAGAKFAPALEGYSRRM